MAKTMKSTLFVRFFSYLLVVLMVAGIFNLAGLMQSFYSFAAVSDTYRFAPSEIGTKEYSSEQTEGRFTILPRDPATTSAHVQIVEHNVSMDGKDFTHRFQLAGTGDKQFRAIKFKTLAAGRMTVYGMSSSNGTPRTLYLDSDKGHYEEFLDGQGQTVLGEFQGGMHSEMGRFVYTLPEADTYYLYTSSGFNIYLLEVEEGTFASPKAWTEVEKPSFGNQANATPYQSGGDIIVPFSALLGYDAADSVTVSMYKGAVAPQNFIEKKQVYNRAADTVAFSPPESGDYVFALTSERRGETSAKTADNNAEFDGFILPLSAPNQSVRTTENSKLLVTVPAIKEADAYRLEYREKGVGEFVAFADSPVSVETAKRYYFETPSLTVGKTYEIKVTALRGETDESVATIKEWTVAQKSENDWRFAAAGESASSANNTSTGNANNGPVTIESKSNSGKFLDSGISDGMAFYYTPIEKERNWVMSASIKVNTWSYSNAQDGFGFFVKDAEPRHGDSSSNYSNSFGFIASKVEYRWDSNDRMVTDLGGEKISMRLGLAARETRGITHESTPPDPGDYVTITTLENSCARLGNGDYNIVGNLANPSSGFPTYGGPSGQGIVDFDITIKKTNTGFHLLYTNEAGEDKEIIMYDWEELFVIDDEFVYVGFGAARNMKITVSDINLTFSDPKTDPPAEPRPITYITTSAKVTSASTSGVKDYNLRFVPNCDGVLRVDVATEKNPTAINLEQGIELKAEQEYLLPYVLSEEITNFSLRFKPDDDFVFDTYTHLSDYREQFVFHRVTHKIIGDDKSRIYVSPTGSNRFYGTKEQPFDILTAVAFAQPGQTIIMLDGTYNMNSSLTIPYGINGTEEKPIRMMADPDTLNRPILDFGKRYVGLVHWGDFWHFRGFDVTNTGNKLKGVQISGNNNIVDQVNVYKNGDTGMQISGNSLDARDKWPKNNLILNCTSYDNADAGRTDADGFAAKITVGTGNVFDGCISYNNADDGYDLFAKAESGTIGQVVIKNSISWQNANNGFKMGGTNMGDHKLINSITYENAYKGIDANSAPRLYCENVVSYNNGTSNVALYTNLAQETRYEMKGVISFRKQTTEKTIHGTFQEPDKYFSGAERYNQSENISPRSPQLTNSPLIRNAESFYWSGSGASAKSSNSIGVTVSEDDFVSLKTVDDSGKSIVPSRYANGSINVNGLLQLTSTARFDKLFVDGARFTETTSPSIQFAGEDLGEPLPEPDLTKPTVTFDMPSSVKAGSVVEVKFLATTTNTQSILPLECSVMVQFNGEFVAVTDNKFTPNEVGEYTIIVYAQDENGNQTEAEFKLSVTAKKGKGCGSVVDSSGFGAATTLFVVLSITSLLALALKKKKVSKI